MVKQLRKTRMRKQFNYQRNRKRVQKKKENKGFIKEELIKKEWQKGKTLSKNLDDMGIVFDANKALSIPNTRKDHEKIQKIINGFVEEDQTDSEDEVSVDGDRPKKHVADILEAQSKEHVESRFRLPKGVCKEVAYYIDQYGLNYKLMAKDERNYYQETWRQIRAKVRKFMSIPEQFSQYLADRDLLDEEIDENDPKWKEAETDDD